MKARPIAGRQIIAYRVWVAISDWELWACAQQVIKQHGADAPTHVASRIGELAAAGDAEGVATWRAIAERVDQLMNYRTGRPLSRQ